MQAALSRHDELLRKTVVDHGGVVFSPMGDELAAALRTASGAVAAAVAAQGCYRLSRLRPCLGARGQGAPPVGS